MDLRTIMNTDAAGASNAPPPPTRQSPSRSSSSDPVHQQRQQHVASPAGPSYPAGYPGRPPQPPPLQPPHASPDRSSSYGSVQSPYQYNSASTLSAGAQSQRGQSPPHGATPFAPGSRDSYSATSSSAVYNQQQQPQSAGSLASPYTPHPMSAGLQHQEAQSYFSQQRSHSIQSVLTPNSISSYSFHPRESPHSAASQSVPPQQFSPHAQRSVPGTPLGPPSATYPRLSPQSARPMSSGHDSQHNPMSSPWAGQDAHAQDQRNIMSPTARPRASRQDSRPMDQTPQEHPTEMERERSASVSPKTVLTSASRHESAAAPQEQSATPRRNMPDDRMWKESPPESVSVPSQPGARSGSQVPQPAPPINSSPISRITSSNEAQAVDQKQSIPQKRGITPELRDNSNAHPPKRIRMRYNEPPIFARMTPRSGRRPVIPNPRPPVPKHARDARQAAWAGRKRSSSAVAPTTPGVPAAPPAARTQVEVAAPVNGPVVRTSPSEPPQQTSLGPWEPAITGFIPHEEITKLICDFLFQHVVLRKDVNAGPAGAAATGQGAIIEVEAKLGQIIDMDSRERLRLPVLTESVLSRESPGVRTSFESSMTLAQHRAMNNFLNEAVKASMPQSNPGRIPLSYAHKKERDTFYEVSPSELPPVIRQNLNPRHKPKVRVTTDQRTGEVIAKIVKCRIADMDVYSPRTFVDWRVSVNLEMDYEGDVRHLPIVDATKGGRGERNKDRMSYRHLAYQIDLTQVAKADPPSKTDFEHELEVEISAAEIRRQGHLAMSGDPKNQYEDLVKGFVDNIRVLARAVPP